jgi:hypothetical protein
MKEDLVLLNPVDDATVDGGVRQPERRGQFAYRRALFRPLNLPRTSIMRSITGMVCLIIPSSPISLIDNPPVDNL